VNVVGYIVSANICPKNSMCLIPDGIMVAETPGESTMGGMYIPTIVPPYEAGVVYVFSVSVSEWHRVRLLGLTPKLRGI
jgi:hypothetical protein